MEDVLGQVIGVLKARRLKGERRAWLSPEARAALAASVAPAPRPRPEAAVAVSAPVRPVPPPELDRPAAAPARSPAVETPVPLAPAPAVSLPSLDLSGRSLEEVRAAVAACSRCDLCRAGRRQTVFSDGDPHAELMFIGEGPGADEDAQGIPFVGAAGQLLTKMIEGMQFRRQEVYICNIVKCRPPNNRQPTHEEGEACLPYLRRQIELVKPRCIVLLGSTALWHLLRAKGITKTHGQWQKFNDIPVMPTYHPSFLLRVPERKRECWNDLQQVMKVFGKSPKPPAVPAAAAAP
ncbi:MAG: uracil-DNA glycosylase [Lentisphaeria bacterium]